MSVRDERGSQPTEPRGCPTPGACSALAEIERLRAALERIAQWADAYPCAVFPKPDAGYLERAAKVLFENGMTMDRIAADCMRHAIEGAGRIAKDALS